MNDFTDQEIAEEAYRIWEAAGRPIWSHASDHWLQALANLRSRQDETAEVVGDQGAPVSEAETLGTTEP